MTKILHTSDWHLGHSLYDFDRTEEQMTMMEQIESIVREEQPDVFLLCGDVYHTGQPSATVQTMFSKAIMRIHQACPGMTMVITAGNHDSGSRHEIFREPWSALNVYMSGNLNKENPEEHLLEIPGKAFVVAVPYAYERVIPEGFFRHLSDLVAERNPEGLPVILSAHTTVRGCDFLGHENASEFSVGGIEAFNLSDFGENYDYIALGHIHHAQFIHGSQKKARYSGTPLPVSFDEQYAHSISLVQLDRHGGTPEVRTIEIRNPHPLVTLPKEDAKPWEDALQTLKEFPSDIPAYIRLNVETDHFLPVGAQEEAIRATEGKLCRFCCINIHRKTASLSPSNFLSVQEFRSEAPIDIAQRYAEDIGFDFNDDMRELFQEIHQQIEQA